MSEGLGPTILLVEDDEDDIFIMKRVLKLTKVTNPLQVVTDGQKAMDYLSGTGAFQARQRYPVSFIVFLDLKISYVHGFEILEWMQRRPELSSIVVVVLTSSAEEKDHQKAYSLGARSYVTKPPTPEGLRDIFDA